MAIFQVPLGALEYCCLFTACLTANPTRQPQGDAVVRAYSHPLEKHQPRNNGFLIEFVITFEEGNQKQFEGCMKIAMSIQKVHELFEEL